MQVERYDHWVSEAVGSRIHREQSETLRDANVLARDDVVFTTEVQRWQCGVRSMTPSPFATYAINCRLTGDSFDAQALALHPSISGTSSSDRASFTRK